MADAPTSQSAGPALPLTGSGVAALADASVLGLGLVQAGFALLGGLALLLGLTLAWSPAIEAALEALPPKDARIGDGRLTWPGETAAFLAERPQLAIGMDPADTGALGRSGDLQLELGRAQLRLRGMLGDLALPYPAEWSQPLTRNEAGAAWNAWNGLIAGCVVGVAIVAQLAAWWLLAAVYAVPVSVLTWLFRKGGGVMRAWKLAAAAILPASLVFDAGILLYAVRSLQPAGLAASFVLSLVAGLMWLLWGLACLPATRGKTGPPSPFSAGKPAAGKASSRRKNPFAG